MTINKNENTWIRQYWLWVTRPEYYLDEDGYERKDLDPNYGGDTSGWWTCHKDTKKGDLVLLYRTSPKKDIAYLIQARSDAYPIGYEDYAAEQGWDYGCEYQVIYKLSPPLTIKDLKNSYLTNEWSPLRQQFQKKVFRIQPSDWKRLTLSIANSQPKYKEFVASLENEPLFERIQLEEELEEKLVNGLGILRPFGFDLELYLDPITGADGRQYVCKGHGGRIDLLCFDIRLNQYVVIELKNVMANTNTFGQVYSYVGWVQKNIAKSHNTIGVVISRGFDVRFEAAMAISRRIRHLNIAKLGYD